jgi:hypothetical protein
MGTVSPLPLSKLGPGPKTYWLCRPAELDDFFFNLFGFGISLLGVVGVVLELLEVGLLILVSVLSEPGSDGRPMRDLAFGGCGKAAMLTDFLTVLSPDAVVGVVGVVAADDFPITLFNVGTSGVEFACV